MCCSQQFKMGNYCCSEQMKQNKTKKLVKLPVSLEKSPQIKTEDSLEWKQTEEKEIISLCKSGEKIQAKPTFPGIEDLQIDEQLGKGGQGQVYKVYIEKTKDLSSSLEKEGLSSPYALKRISKTEKSLQGSRFFVGSRLLLDSTCPFIVEGLFCCENEKFLYQVMEIAEGGDLSTFLERTIGKGDAFRKIGQAGIRMVLAGIVLGLEYLHNNKYIHCDLKVDNVLIGRDGYPLLSDLQLATKGDYVESQKFQGTITSVAPEILLQDKVDKSIDLWALGVLIYSLIYEENPYEPEQISDGSFVDICKKREGKYGLKRKRASLQILSLINGLLKFDPSTRLGYKSFQQLKDHPFFKDFDWDLYYKKQMPSPLQQIVKKYTKKRSLPKRRLSLEMSSSTSVRPFSFMDLDSSVKLQSTV